MNVDEYLRRINSENLKGVLAANLKLIHRNHLRHVPFENLDLMQNKVVDLRDIEDIYNKCVRQERGGLCFELNSLLHWLLIRLGYDVKFMSCRHYLPDSKHFTPWFYHLALMVRLDVNKEFVVDCGFACGFSMPLLFKLDEIQVDKTGQFMIKKSNDETIYTILRNNSPSCANFQPLYQFDTRPRRIEEFIEAAQVVQSPAWPLIYNRSICAKHTEHGYVTLIGLCKTSVFFDEVDNNTIETRRESEVLSDAQVHISIKYDFGIKNFNLYEFVPKDARIEC